MKKYKYTNTERSKEGKSKTRDQKTKKPYSPERDISNHK